MMHESFRSGTLDRTLAKTVRNERYIFIACPWTPVGGGMFKVADYLIQSQAELLSPGAARLRPLDTRGADRAVFSLWFLLVAVGKILVGRMRGGLAGVHVNVAERMSLFRKGTLIVACAAVGVPTVLHLHAQMYRFYDTLPRILRSLTRWVFSLPQAVIVIGPVTRKFVIEVLHVPPDRVRTIMNGVPEQGGYRATARSGGRQRALFVGNLSNRKGLPELLRALADPALDPSRLELVIAGGGDIAGYQAQASAAGVAGMVRFEGWCDQQKVSRLLADCDLLVLPSHDEVLPLVILEALAHEVPVVTTAVGEIPSLLTDGVDVVFVAPGDPASIAAGMQKVLADPALRQSLTKNGRALYLLHCSLAAFFSSVANVHRRYFGVAGQFAAARTPR
ncbi:MAG: glycosyltransferase family 4 protein [Pseudomonadota bacterium]|nr:glycosyltransferase family 4 protein [Pseudomonadota bacterium]